MSKKIVAGTAVSRATFLKACGAALFGAHIEPLALLEAAAQPSVVPRRVSAA